MNLWICHFNDILEQINVNNQGLVKLLQTRFKQALHKSKISF